MIHDTFGSGIVFSGVSYTIETGLVSLNKHGEELCGDNVVISQREDSVIAVLSDGLGSGVKANILATLTSKIAGTMLEMGANLDEVVETVGQTLPICKVRGLAYSTFTIMQAFRDGRVYMAEFDNPSVFYLHRGRVTSLPRTERDIAGKKVKNAISGRSWGFLGSNFRWRSPCGDRCCAQSRMAVANVANFLEKAVVQERNAANVARRLGDICHRLYAGKPGDDATIVALHIRRPRHVTLAVGPPKNRHDDHKMAQLLEAAPGKKVVCGGTTSNIIAREWKTNLEVDLRSLSPTIPPLGRISGVDLVTEGIITISGTLEKLKSLHEGKGFGEVLTGEDGASLLAAMLWGSDEIHFLVEEPLAQPSKPSYLWV